jgi:hypothetical protein
VIVEKPLTERGFSFFGDPGSAMIRALNIRPIATQTGTESRRGVRARVRTALWSSWQNRSLAEIGSQKRERRPVYVNRNDEELFIANGARKREP